MAVCSVCDLRSNRRGLDSESLKRALYQVDEFRLCEEHAGEIVAIVLGEIPPKDPPDDELLVNVLAHPERASTEELMRGFALATARPHPEYEGGDEW